MSPFDAQQVFALFHRASAKARERERLPSFQNINTSSATFQLISLYAPRLVIAFLGIAQRARYSLSLFARPATSLPYDVVIFELPRALRFIVSCLPFGYTFPYHDEYGSEKKKAPGMHLHEPVAFM